jgi:hypothetical protein
MIEAFQEQLITIDELRGRMPDLRARERNLRGQLDALDTQLADRDAYLKLADDLEGFLAQLRSNADLAATSQRQRVLRLLVKDILIGPETITIRHRIPVRESTTHSDRHRTPTTQRVTCAPVIDCVGGVVSPLLANVYLHRLDRAWSSGQHGVLVRFADDVVVMCRSREQAEAALERLRVLLAELGLVPKAAKTRIRARDRIREITGRKWLWMPVKDIVRDLNLFLRGWAGYFRYGNSARVLGQIRNYALQRLAIWLSKKSNRRRAWRWGLKQLLLSPNRWA